MFHIEISFQTIGNVWTEWSDHDKTGYKSIETVMDVIHELRAEGDHTFRFRPVFDSEDEGKPKIIFGHEP